MFDEGERPRRPGKVILLVVVFWLVGTAMQQGLGWLAALPGIVGDDAAMRIGQVVAWGLLFVLSLVYRHQVDAWLRR